MLFNYIKMADPKMAQSGIEEWEEFSHEHILPTMHEFHLFPELPPELQDAVWEACLPMHSRLISVPLRRDIEMPAQRLYTKTNDHGRRVSGAQYRTAFPDDDFNVRCPLLAVSRSARKVAKDYYPIQMPATTCSGKRLLLCLNPEYDSMNIKDMDVKNPFIIHFMNDLRSYDTHNRGIINLVIEKERIQNLNSVLQMGLLGMPELARAQTRDTLRSLGSVWIMALDPFISCYENIYQATMHHPSYGVSRGIPMNARSLNFDQFQAHSLQGLRPNSTNNHSNHHNLFPMAPINPHLRICEQTRWWESIERTFGLRRETELPVAYLFAADYYHHLDIVQKSISWPSRHHLEDLLRRCGTPVFTQQSYADKRALVAEYRYDRGMDEIPASAHFWMIPSSSIVDALYVKGDERGLVRHGCCMNLSPRGAGPANMNQNV